ncbi:hypothetical protein EB796_007878 [Bugula neritina]|uniref:Uncharacterized protein n=1 Tax=Bugula neritina TaxID=10212 RepID=A0A7J7K5A7_BUGNE|nr:hypothetical protein EB796_007878 [Bugula neritina]
MLVYLKLHLLLLLQALHQRTVRMGKLTILTSADALIESLISKAYKKALDFYEQEMKVITNILTVNK